MGNGRCGYSRGVLGTRDVRRFAGDLEPFAAECLDRGGERDSTAGAQKQPCAGLSERTRDLESQAAARPGDQRRSTLEDRTRVAIQRTREPFRGKGHAAFIA